MDPDKKRSFLDELIKERDKLTRLWIEVQGREKTLEDAKRCYEAQTAWEKLYKRFVAEVITTAPGTSPY